MEKKISVEAVVTSFNQGVMLLEAVESLYEQTLKPERIIIVDDGSTDEKSLGILKKIETTPHSPVPLSLLRQPNGGVSCARNTGIRHTQTDLVLVLDGDDRLAPSFIREAGELLYEDPALTAASSWMQTFGVLDSIVRPQGGGVCGFLSHNCCPATHMFRRTAWERCGGYDETMRSGFEDWDFFLSMLEAVPDSRIGIVEKPLIHYRTAPASSNIRSMSKRLDLMGCLIEKHKALYREHIAEAVLGVEAISMSRLYGWENEIVHTLETHGTLHPASEAFLESPAYGDGGMAAAVRVRSPRK